MSCRNYKATTEAFTNGLKSDIQNIFLQIYRAAHFQSCLIKYRTQRKAKEREEKKSFQFYFPIFMTQPQTLHQYQHYHCFHFLLCKTQFVLLGSIYFLRRCLKDHFTFRNNLEKRSQGRSECLL